MTDADFERLFWEAFDEPSSTARLERIEKLSASRPEMKRELEELRALAGELDAVQEVTPPPELRVEVRRRVVERPAYAEAIAAPFVDRLRQALTTGWGPRLAYATLGALIGILGTSLLVGLFVGGLSPITEAERSRLSGALNVTAADARSLEIPLAGSAGTLRFARRGTRLVSTLHPAANTTLELSLARGQGGLEPLRIERIQATRHVLAARPGAVRLVADGSVSLVLDAEAEGSSTLTARVKTATGETILDRQLDLTQLADAN